MPDLNITLIQSNVVWENSTQNLERYHQKIEAIKEDTDLIVLPEMFSTGFSMKAEKLAEEMGGYSMQWMQQTAAQKNAVICGSIILKEDGKFYNRLIWMRPDGTYEKYDKRHMFRMAGEEHTYSPGRDRLLVSLNGWKICPQVCYDLRFPVWNRNRGDYDLLIMVANWPERRVEPWKTLLLARAIENQAYVCGVNRIGDDGNQVYHSGASSVIDPKGQILFQNEKEEVVHTEQLSKEFLDKFRSDFPVHLDADEFSVQINE